jgi:branched-chain amino acid transport system ATP-binding protein
MLEIVDIHKEFDGLKVLNGVSLEVKKGHVVGLIGPNGSGKTTLFNVIAGVYKPTGGKILLDGEPVHGLKPDQLYRKGLVRTFQIPRPFRNLTVLDNLLLASRNQRGEKFARVFNFTKWKMQERELVEKAEKTLELINLIHLQDEYAGNLSGGQLKLLELGRALMSDPKILLLDEPAGGVNPTLAMKLFAKIDELAHLKNLTFFIIEHRMETLLNYSDYMFVLYKGRVIVEGKPQEVMEDEKVIEVYLGEL